MVEPESSQMTIWRLRIACWIPKVANTHSNYVTIIAFPLQQWVQNAPQYYVILILFVFFISRITDA